MNNREKLVELIRLALMDNIGKSCNLAENITDYLIACGVTFKNSETNFDRLLKMDGDSFAKFMCVQLGCEGFCKSYKDGGCDKECYKHFIEWVGSEGK